MKNEYKVEGDVVTMEVKGRQVIFDAADIPLVSQYMWKAYGNNHICAGFRNSSGAGCTIYLHKLLTGSKHAQWLNGDVCDYRRVNVVPSEKVIMRRKRGGYLKGNKCLIENNTIVVLIVSKGITHEAYVDYEDYPLISQYTWCLNPVSGYAQTIDRITRKGIYMHRLIMSATDFYDKIDHINGNRIDNRKRNLRICGDSQNHHNNIKHKNGTSGIYEHTKDKYWTACLMIKGKDIHRQKTFKKYEDAVAQRRAWEKEFNPSGLNGEN